MSAAECRLYTREEIRKQPFSSSTPGRSPQDDIVLHIERILATHPTIEHIIIDPHSSKDLFLEQVFAPAAYAQGVICDAMHYRPGVNDGVCQRAREITFGLMWEQYIVYQVLRRVSA